MAQLSKFDELRLKTERQLVQLICNELDLGIREARQALNAETWAFAQNHYLRAQQAYTRASRLIPLVREIPDGKADRPEARVVHLREMLDGLSVLASTPTPTSESVSAVARALWKARGCPEGSAEDDWYRAERALRSQKAIHAVGVA
jgi:hypothetical protein